MRSAPWRSVFVALSAGGCLVFSGTFATADILTLKTGEVFSGRVLRSTPEEVSIQLESGGILSFRTNRVESLRIVDRSGEGGKDLIFNKAPVPEPKADPGAGKSSSGRSDQKKGSPPSTKAPSPTPPEKKDGSKSGQLSAFPLHAKRHSAASIEGQALDESLRILDTEKGYSIIPPRGFNPWTDQKLPPMVQGFLHPANQANLTISTYDSDEGLEKIKEGIVAILKAHSNAKVMKETRRTVQGQNGYNGWVLSIENSVVETKVNQLQLIAKDCRRVFIVTYSCASKHYPACQRAFEESLESFRVERWSSKSPTETGSGPRASGLPGPATEEELKGYRADTSRLIERVDEKIRNAPLPYYPK